MVTLIKVTTRMKRFSKMPWWWQWRKYKRWTRWLSCRCSNHPSQLQEYVIPASPAAVTKKSKANTLSNVWHTTQRLTHFPTANTLSNNWCVGHTAWAPRGCEGRMLPFQWWLQRWLERWLGRWSIWCGPWSIDYNDYNDYDDDLKDNGEGDPQDAHLGRAAEVQDEDWDKAQSSASSKRGGYHEDFSKMLSLNVVVITRFEKILLKIRCFLPMRWRL